MGVNYDQKKVSRIRPFHAVKLLRQGSLAGRGGLVNLEAYFNIKYQLCKRSLVRQNCGWKLVLDHLEAAEAS
jgi:hypothetical protein